jgi:hypothetical protein
VPSRPVGGVGLVVSDTVKSLLITVFRDGGCCGSGPLATMLSSLSLGAPPLTSS